MWRFPVRLLATTARAAATAAPAAAQVNKLVPPVWPMKAWLADPEAMAANVRRRRIPVDTARLVRSMAAGCARGGGRLTGPQFALGAEQTALADAAQALRTARNTLGKTLQQQHSQHVGGSGAGDKAPGDEAARKLRHELADVEVTDRTALYSGWCPPRKW